MVGMAFVQGGYFLVTGVWPLLHIESFQKVTRHNAEDEGAVGTRAHSPAAS